MTELLAPGELSAEAAAELLAERLPVRNGKVCRIKRTFYDTFDGRLYAAGVMLACSGDDVTLAERASGAVRARWAGELPAGPVPVLTFGPGPLHDALTELADVRALLPIASVAGRERPFDLLDSEGKTVVRLALEEARGLEPRLRVTGVRGYDSELAALRAALVDELGFRVAEEPLVDAAVRAAGGAPGGVSSKIEVALAFDQRADGAAAAVLRRLLEVIEANVEGAIAGTDTEFLHDLRVAVRRTRSVQRELRAVFPPAALERFRREFRWLQQATGPARDLDVYGLEFDSLRALVPARMRADLDPVLEVLEARRLTARRAMVRALRSKRAVSLLADWSQFLAELESGSGSGSGSGTDSGGAAERAIGELAGERIRAVYRRMRRLGGAIDAASPAADYHELRKKGKELRYLLELFGAPLYPAEVVKPMIKTLKALQDVLGRHQDREVQVAMIYSLGPSVAEHPRALMAMGVLVQRLGEDELAARAAFAERFSAFASDAQRALVKATFR